MSTKVLDFKTTTTSYLRLNSHTHRTQFGNAAGLFILQEQINQSTIEDNFGKYEE